jgi:hypothetical protein
MSRLATQAEILAVAEAGIPLELSPDDLLTAMLKIMLVERREQLEMAEQIQWIEWRERA